jgi:glycosyltransferase involved in cell wall biosynthesis
MSTLGSIAIAFPGDASARGTWSGTPAGLAGGFEELGFAVTRIDARPPRPIDAMAFNAVALARTRPGGSLKTALRRGRAVARLTPEVAAVRALGVAGRLRRAGRFDAVVQIGTGYTVPLDAPVATFEDITIPQAIALEYPGWQALSAAAVRRRMDRQRRAYARATACCFSTRWAADSAIVDYGVDPAKVHSVGLGRNQQPRPAERDWAAPRFLFVGVDWEGKNGPGVLRAFARLRAELPDARLDVVGVHPPLDAPGVTGHGPLRMGVPDEKARLEALFESATCFVLPSHREASAIVYIEAASAGLPVIGSAAGGSRDLIGDGGCVVDPAADEDLLAAMRRFADADLARRVGALAQRRAELFTWRKVAERIVGALALPQLPAATLAPSLEAVPAGAS